jgi:hypothetical protein
MKHISEEERPVERRQSDEIDTKKLFHIEESAPSKPLLGVKYRIEPAHTVPAVKQCDPPYFAG